LFETTIDLIKQYYNTAHIMEHPDFDADLAAEVRVRLEQLDYLLDRVGTAEGALTEINQEHGEKVLAQYRSLLERGRTWDDEMPVSMSEAESEAFNANMFEVKLFTECFYYIAYRILTIANKRYKGRRPPLPGLQGLKPKGVVMARNHLLEHAGHINPITVQTFMAGGPHGPILKQSRREGQTDHPDKGLYANAQQFKDDLEDRLRRAIEQPPA
jgi:hypothetical protein